MAKSNNPDEAGAYGAAFQDDILNGGKSEEVQDVAALSRGISNLNVSADKSTGKEDKITITNDKDDETDKKVDFYGAVPGIGVGKEWPTRLECYRDGVHRQIVAGIHGGESGAYSIALSGEYEDDEDLGDRIIYAGEGGRDLKGTNDDPKNLRTPPQTRDQTLTRGNLALSKNVETRNPVRVIRGYKLDSPFAPEKGYRYDGLYTVEKYSYTTGRSGYLVYKFVLERCPDQPPIPWQFSSEPNSPAKSATSDDTVKT